MGLERFMLPRAFGPRSLLIGWQLVKRREKQLKELCALLNALIRFLPPGEGLQGHWLAALPD
jgi:hypothetical protein